MTRSTLHLILHVLVPGHGSGYLTPLEGSPGEDVRQVHVFARLDGPNRTASFTIRDVHVAPPHLSQTQRATSIEAQSVVAEDSPLD